MNFFGGVLWFAPFETIYAMHKPSCIDYHSIVPTIRSTIGYVIVQKLKSATTRLARPTHSSRASMKTNCLKADTIFYIFIFSMKELGSDVLIRTYPRTGT